MFSLMSALILIVRKNSIFKKMNMITIFIIILLVFCNANSQNVIIDQTVSANSFINSLQNNEDREKTDQLFKEYLDTLWKTQDSFGRTLYFFQGDIPMLEQQVREVLESTIEEAATESSEELATVSWDFELDRYLTYAIDRSSFPSYEEYIAVMDAIHDAADDWEEACTACELKFEHQVEFDRNPSHDYVDFIVQKKSCSEYDRGCPLASAYFPTYPISMRYISITEKWFQNPILDKTGVMRHEIGHILGYRHEHVGLNIGCSYKVENDGQWNRETEYDSNSVMHYYCSITDLGTKELIISNLDKEGHQKIYGVE